MTSQALARRILRTTGWTVQGEPPPDPVVVLVAAPHTSNWDFAVMLLLSRAFGIQAKFLGKQELFRGPLGPFMRWTGGISIDRENPAGVVDELVAHASAAERFQLVIAAEGTRKPKQYWKSGFYRMAEQAGIPICLGFCDGPSRTMGYGPTFRPSGDVRADMDLVRAFYADKHGINPENRTEPRLRDEDAPAAEPTG
ncbi:MAG: 1-acyl-sn-glycerol-3-phosphate acyltransferase [Candidatus Nanopelagicales bacterium]|nr:1-acyl-sn-glycerol-3-phosphate acyltransferase [Candidatus Nanopelagicales bacterium]